MAQIDFTILEKALAILEDALTPPPKNDRERDGAIQRFEYTFELTWKLGKKVLEDSGIVSNSPKSVIRDLAQQNWIQDAELWMSFLRARNATVHTYKDTTADDVFSKVQKFPKECRSLLFVLKTAVKSE